MSYNPNPITIVLILLLAKNSRGLLPAEGVSMINTLQLEAFLDNAKKMISLIDKLNSFSQQDGNSPLPDVNKILEIVDKIPL